MQCMSRGKRVGVSRREFARYETVIGKEWRSWLLLRTKLSSAFRFSQVKNQTTRRKNTHKKKTQCRLLLFCWSDCVVPYLDIMYIKDEMESECTSSECID